MLPGAEVDAVAVVADARVVARLARPVILRRPEQRVLVAGRHSPVAVVVGAVVLLRLRRKSRRSPLSRLSALVFCRFTARRA